MQSDGRVTINSQGVLNLNGENTMVWLDALRLNGAIESNGDNQLLYSESNIQTNNNAQINSQGELLQVSAPNLSGLIANYPIADGTNAVIPTSSCNPIGLTMNKVIPMKRFLVLPGIISLLLITPILGQVYSVPFGSEGNRIELDVVNVGDSQSKNIVVKAVSYPSWVNIKEPNQYLNPLQINDQSLPSLAFPSANKHPLVPLVYLHLSLEKAKRCYAPKKSA